MNRISTPILTLALVASLSFTASVAEAKLVKPSTYTNNVVVGKVFYAGAKDANNKNYLNSKYVELYNISTDTLDLSGMYLGLVEGEAKASAWTSALLQEQHPDSIALKQVFRLPAGAKLDPYASLLIANSATDHSANGTDFPNLSAADYEVKDAAGKVPNNPDVPALELVYSCYAAISNMNLVQSGPCGVVLFTENTKVDQMPLVFSPGKEKGNQFMLIPKSSVIDGVEIVKMGEEDIVRLNGAGIDAGTVAITSKTGYTGEVVYRKTAYVVGGVPVLFDTNNSTVDFGVSASLQPRQYDMTASGLTDFAITIPESGYLAFTIDQPFCGPRDMVLCFVNASNNSTTTDLRYQEFRGDSTLLMKGDWIAIAKPGTYNLQLSSSQGIMKTRTSIQSWCADDTKSMSQTNRSYYKFQNVAGRIGFQRVPKTAQGYYNFVDCTDGNRLILTLPDAVADKIAAANQASSHVDLDFIAWHGATPEQAAASVRPVAAMTAADTRGGIFDLQGRRVIKPTKGIYVKDRKIVILK